MAIIKRIHLLCCLFPNLEPSPGVCLFNLSFPSKSNAVELLFFDALSSPKKIPQRGRAFVGQGLKRTEFFFSGNSPKESLSTLKIYPQSEKTDHFKSDTENCCKKIVPMFF